MVAIFNLSETRLSSCYGILESLALRYNRLFIVGTLSELFMTSLELAIRRNSRYYAYEQCADIILDIRRRKKVISVVFESNTKARCLSWVAVCVLVIFCAGACVCSEQTWIRVGLTRFNGALKSLDFSSDSGLKLIDASGEELLASDENQSIRISTEGDVFVAKTGLQVNSATGGFVQLVPRLSTGTVKIDLPGWRMGCIYRGRIELRLKPTGMQVINVLPVEDYLLGVVPSEMPSSYPIEALKAQAITARTYALANLRKHRSADYDLCDTSHCQIYGGVSAETLRATQAVTATSGLVLTYNGKPASVMYTSDCGGATQNASARQPNSHFPYLCGTIEPPDMPHSTWEINIPLQQLGKKLAAAGIKEGCNLVAISIAKTDDSGRVQEFEIGTDSGKTIVNANKVRAAIGMNVMKSLLVTVEQREDGTVVFKGRGAGHGIGLCQVGAKWLALPPRNWTSEQILAHYFPGAVIEKLGTSCAEKLVTVPESSNSEATSEEYSKLNPHVPKIFDVRVSAPDGL